MQPRGGTKARESGSGQEIPGGARGAAVQGNRLYTWGSRLLVWDLRNLRSKELAISAAGFGEGGCVDSDGSVLVQDGPEAGPLVHFSSAGRRTVWDSRVEMHDCLFAAILGRKGALITDHYGQVRFYEGPGRYQEVYSFYTPSRQAGLLLGGVDGDGVPDIYSGNYWIRSPAEFDLPWRLFAINTRHETPDSATMRLVLYRGDLYAAQGHMKDGSLFRYRPPADVTRLWNEDVIATGLRFPHALAEGPAGIVVGENAGPGSGLFAVAAGGGKLERIASTDGLHSAFIVNGRILGIGSQTIGWWTVQRRR